MDNRQKELLYLAAKDRYYNGTPIDLPFYNDVEMLDSEFDRLEEELRAIASPVVNIVGAGGKHLIKHLIPQKSLSKIQVAVSSNMPMDDIIHWYTTMGITDEIEATCKYDGNACLLTYVDGRLATAASRGDGTHGHDITSKLGIIAPKTIDEKGIVIVKGEVVVSLATFHNKYSDDYANARNFVSGQLNPENDKVDHIIPDLTFIAYEMESPERLFDEHIKRLGDLGFNQSYTPFRRVLKSIHDFENVYYEFETYRMNTVFLLDGIVLKAKPHHRERIGGTSHHPKWAKAIKFPAIEAESKIEEIEWKIGKTGELTPRARITPTDLDGATISYIGLHNLGYVIEKQAYVGAKIVFARKGDIVPQIIKVSQLSPDTAKYDADPTLLYPTNIDHDTLYVDGVHLMSNDSSVVELRKLQKTVEVLGIKRIGDATVERLFNAGLKTLEDVLNAREYSKKWFIDSGEFKDGRELEIVMEALGEITEFKLETLIHGMQFDDVGRSVSREVAKEFAYNGGNFTGLNKTAVALFDDGEKGFFRLWAVLQLCQTLGIEVVKPEPPKADVVTFEMTGKPTTHGTKKDFLAAVAGKATHTSLKAGTDFLVTDSMSSSSSKMKKAEKLGVEILTYDDFIAKLN